MITCTLGEKKYCVDFVTGRAVREMGPAIEMYGRIMRDSERARQGAAVEENISIADAMDVLVTWFCILFGNQFTPEDVYDHYPADRLMHDISLALMATQAQSTQILSEFPTKAERVTPQKTQNTP